MTIDSSQQLIPIAITCFVVGLAIGFYVCIVLVGISRIEPQIERFDNLNNSTDEGSQEE